MRGSVPHRPLARIKSIAPSLVAPVLQINKEGWPRGRPAADRPSPQQKGRGLASPDQFLEWVSWSWATLAGPKSLRSIGAGSRKSIRISLTAP
jgi:hypothetical protein